MKINLEHEMRFIPSSRHQCLTWPPLGHVRLWLDSSWNIPAESHPGNVTSPLAGGIHPVLVWGKE